MPATCVEDSVRAAAAAFVRQIGRLSHEPQVRDSLLTTAVHEVARQLLDEFRDHYRLAEQLEIMGRLARFGPEAFHAAELAGPAAMIPSGRRIPGPQPDNDRTVLAPGGSSASSPKSRQLAHAALAELEC
jgi:hypothetical protein